MKVLFEKACSFEKIIILILLCGSTFMLISCPAPITESSLLNLKDGTGPIIKIVTPEEGSSYASTVVVEGLISDFSDPVSESVGEITAMSYEVVNSTLSGDIHFTKDGIFNFQFSTATLTGTIVIKVSATDWNQNTSEFSLTLIDEGAIPSFTATPDSKQVTLQWDPVPLSLSYDLYYTIDGTVPSEYYGNHIYGVSSPCIIDGLENGELHGFVLKSVSAEGSDNWSEPIYSIPLSSSTLSPRITGKFGKIYVNWEAIPAADRFEVWRQNDRTDSAINISGSLNKTEFIDAEITAGDSYYYFVKPVLPGSISSGTGSGTSYRFPEIKERVESIVRSQGGARDIVIRDSYAYIAANSSGLEIYDLSDPELPVLVGTAACNDYALGIAVQGNYACIADSDAGLTIYNIQQPTAPYIEGSTGDLGDGAQQVCISGNYAYVAAYDAGLQIIYLGNPSVPIVAGSYDLDYANGVDVQDDYVYITDLVNGLRIFNVQNKNNPVLDGTYDTDWAQDVEVYGNYAYIADNQYGIKIADISVSTSPQPSGTYIDADYTGGIDYAKGIAVEGNMAYVSDYSGGIKMLNISDPSTPTMAASCTTPGSIESTAVKDDYAYSADYNSGIYTINIAAPAGLSVKKTITFSEAADDVQVQGDYAYVADRWDGLKIVNIKDIDYAEVVGSYNTDGNARTVTVFGDFAYIGDGGNGLQIIDITSAADPHPAGGCDTPGDAHGVSLKGDYAFLCDGTKGVQIIDISDPAEAEIVSWYEISGQCYSIDIQGEYAYITAISNFAVLDISDPLRPELESLTPFSDPNWVYDVAVKGDYAFLASYGGGITILDISVPSSPVEIPNSLTFSDSVFGVSVHGDYLYVCAGTEGLKIINIEDPESPVHSASIDTDGYAVSVDVEGRFAYLAEGVVDMPVIELYPDW